MHDPMTVAHEIRAPWWRRYSWDGQRYHPTLVTIWHVDPEKDGSDDSCGWFARARHGDKEVLEKIVRDFEFHWDKDYGRLFNDDGTPYLSAMAITLNLFCWAAQEHFNHNRRKTDRFIARHLHEILHFAENPTDSLHENIVMKYGLQERQVRIDSMARVVYGCILRWTRPWYRHPRWHIHHWKIQVHCLLNLKRWLFSRCERCGKRFKWGEAPCSGNWNGTGPLWFRSEKGVYHSNCFGQEVSVQQVPANQDAVIKDDGRGS